MTTGDESAGSLCTSYAEYQIPRTPATTPYFQAYLQHLRDSKFKNPRPRDCFELLCKKLITGPMAPATELPSSTVGDARIAYESPETVHKRGQAFRLRREVEAMKFVQGLTSIPVPAVLETHFDIDGDEESWILMKRLPGRQLGEETRLTMSETAQAQTIRQLKSHFQQLHHLHQAEPRWIGSCSRGPAYDHRLDNITTCGPFASVSEFHDFLVAPVRKSPRPEWVAKYRSKLPDSHRIIFAHADV
jgi:Phosphotransferase enzyme family